MENKIILRGDFMKYDIKKTDYNDKKAIGYYSFLVTNCIQAGSPPPRHGQAWSADRFGPGR